MSASHFVETDLKLAKISHTKPHPHARGKSHAITTVICIHPLETMNGNFISWHSIVVAIFQSGPK